MAERMVTQWGTGEADPDTLALTTFPVGTNGDYGWEVRHNDTREILASGISTSEYAAQGEADYAAHILLVRKMEAIRARR